jgi:hypothetical protein
MLKQASIILACAIAAFQATATQAQTAYPARDVTFIVPWNAGGSNDVAIRALDPILREHGIKVLIENVVGATGTIGMRRVATAPPDGYTIGMGTSSTLALIAQGKTPLTNAQFTHVARVSTDPLMLLVPTKSEQKSLDDFIKHMKGHPDKVTIGTPGNYNRARRGRQLRQRALHRRIEGGRRPARRTRRFRRAQAVGNARADSGRPAQADRHLRQRTAGDVSRCADLQGKGIRRVPLRPCRSDGLCSRPGQPAH